MTSKHRDGIGQWRPSGSRGPLWLMSVTLVVMFMDAHGLFFSARQDELRTLSETQHQWFISRCHSQTRRQLQKAGDVTPTTTVPQFKDSTEKFVGVIPRLDPLKGFKRYSGAFNVTDTHYWSMQGKWNVNRTQTIGGGIWMVGQSVAFTGIWGYAAALFCLIFGGWAGIWNCYTWRKTTFKELIPYSIVIRSVPIFCAIQFSILLLAAAGVIFWGNIRLGHELQATAGTLIGTVDKVKGQVDDAVSLIPIANIGPIANQEIAQKFLAACDNLASTFKDLTGRVKVNKARVYKLFYSVKVAVAVIATLMVVMVVGGIFCMLKGWHVAIIMMFSLAIFVLVASWMVSGLSFVLASVATDGCQAMQVYDQNPHNSSIARLLPCLTPAAAAVFLGGAKKAIKIVIKHSNAAVDLLNNEEEKLVAKGEIKHATHLPHICDPFGPGPKYNPMTCSPAEGSFTHFQRDYGQYHCSIDDISSCLASNTPIPNFAFLEATQAMNATKDVFLILPTIFRIITCNFVKMTFEDILGHQCEPLKAALTVLWVAFIIASMALMPLLVLWMMHGKSIASSRVTFDLRSKVQKLGIEPTC